jgi:hypothetical protein
MVARKDHDSRKQFALEMLLHIAEDRLSFSDEATCHMCGTVNRIDCRVWESENPHDISEHERDSVKVNVGCAVMREDNYGSSKNPL